MFNCSTYIDAEILHTSVYRYRLKPEYLYSETLNRPTVTVIDVQRRRIGVTSVRLFSADLFFGESNGGVSRNLLLTITYRVPTALGTSSSLANDRLRLASENNCSLNVVIRRPSPLGKD